MYFSALQEAQDIFGVDFDFEEFEQYRDDEEELEEEEEEVINLSVFTSHIVEASAAQW